MADNMDRGAGEKLRDGIFSLRTRRLGTVAEYIIKRLLRYSKRRNQFHDLYDDANELRVEVKFSVVQKQADRAIEEETVLQCIEEATAEERMVAFSEWAKHRFDCNIQQVKRAEFDILYYGLFFSDCVAVFRIRSEEIKENASGGLIYYSDFQHKGNSGEGQFHLNEKTLPVHLRHYLYRMLSYGELHGILASER